MSVLMYLKKAFGEDFRVMWASLSNEDREEMREAARTEMRELRIHIIGK